MDSMKNEVRIDLRTNQTLREAASRVPDGEDMKIELTFRKVGVEGDSLRGQMKTIAIAGLKMRGPDGTEMKELEADTEAPTAVDIEAL